MPDHPGDVPTGTKNNILNQLEEDLEHWEQKLSQDEMDNGDANDRS